LTLINSHLPIQSPPECPLSFQERARERFNPHPNLLPEGEGDLSGL
jgi:hypothetical protein